MLLNKLKSPPVAFALISIFDKLVSLILLPVFVQSVGVADYGKLYFLHALNMFMSPVLDVGFVLYFISNYYKCSTEHNSRLLGNYFIIELGLGFILMILTSLILSIPIWEMSKLDTVTYMLVFSLLPVLSNISKSSVEVFRIKMRIRQVFMISITAFIVDVVVSIFLLKVVELGWHSRIIGLVCNNLVVTFFCLIVLRKHYQLSIDRGIIRDWFVFGLPVIRHRIVSVFQNLGDRYLINGILGNYYLGLYTLAHQITSPLVIVNNAVKAGWNPWFYKNIVNNKRPWSFFQRLMLLITGGFGLFAFGYTMILPYIVSFFLDDVNLSEVIYISLWLGVAYGCQLVYLLNLPYLIHHSRSRVLANITTLSGLVSIFGNLFLLKEFGILVSAIVFFISWVIQASLVTYFGFKERRKKA